MSDWYLAGDGKGFGPFSIEQLRQLHGAGLLAANDLVWQQGAAASCTIEGIAPVLLVEPSSASVNQPPAISHSSPQSEEDTFSAILETSSSKPSHLTRKKRPASLNPLYIWGGALAGLGVIACVAMVALPNNQPSTQAENHVKPSTPSQSERRTPKTETSPSKMKTAMPKATAVRSDIEEVASGQNKVSRPVAPDPPAPESGITDKAEEQLKQPLPNAKTPTETLTGPAHFVIHATHPTWVGTGVKVKPQHTVVVEATGRITLDKNNLKQYPYVSADGQRGAFRDFQGIRAENGCLLLKVGSRVYKGGTSARIAVLDAGEIELGILENGKPGNNAGTFQVTLTVLD